MKLRILLAGLIFSVAPLLLALSIGESAPGFSAKNQDGKQIQLADYRGKFVLVYFYPKDDTPGCTKEACQFRDEFSKVRNMNTVILGISRQNEKSHREFRSKHHLPFDLLVDEDGKIADSFGIGSIPILGFTKRKSVLIDPAGKVAKIYQNVDPSSHAREVMNDIQTLFKR